MVLAYLRGLLKPDYRFSLQSFLREAVILQVLDREHQAELGIQRLLLEASFSSQFTAAGAKRVLEQIRQDWQRYYQLSEYLVRAPIQVVQCDENGKALADIYQALEKSGILQQIAERDKNIEQEITQDFR